MKEITILGAGISGLTAAINLSKAGYQINVYEIGKDCGTRFKGDLQGIENWSSKTNVLKQFKSMNIKINFEYSPFKEVIFTDGEVKNSIDLNKPLFYLVKRGSMKGSLDQALKKQALKSGVNIKFNSTIKESKADIIATGPKKAFGLCAGISFETGDDNIAVFLINNDANHNCYSYLLIRNGYGCICTLLTDKFHLAQIYLNKTLDIFKNMFSIKMRNIKKVGGVCYFSLNRKFMQQNRMYVGEASGLQDAFCGFGIRSSMISGYFASKSILEGKDYAELMDETTSKFLKASVVNRFIWEKIILKNPKNLIEKLEKTKNLSNLIYNVYNYSLPIQKVLYPIAISWAKKRFRY